MASFIELTDEGLRASAGISQEEGSAEATYRLYGTSEGTPPTVNDISLFFDFWNGGVGNAEPKVTAYGTAGGGKINRILPPVHPFRPELSSAGVVSMTGVGQHASGVPVQVSGLTPATLGFPLWQAFDYKVRFTKRPYYLLADDRIATKRGPYFTPDGSEIAVVWAEEWRRFTKMTVAPLPDTVTATDPAGMMKFRTQSGTPAPDGVDNSQFPGSPYMSLLNSSVEVEWFLVPARYSQDHSADGVVYKSYLNRFMGCVNQTSITICGRLFEKGSLLFMGATPQTFIPATPKQKKLLKALGVGLEQSMLMNVKLKFLHTAREGTDVPNDAHALLGNKNNIAAGWNLQPNYATRQFHLVTAGKVDATDAERTFCHRSFEFALFFTDPMLAQPAGPI